MVAKILRVSLLAALEVPEALVPESVVEQPAAATRPVAATAAIAVRISRCAMTATIGNDCHVH